MYLSDLNKSEVLELIQDSIEIINSIFNKISDKKQIFELNSIATKGSDKALILELEKEVRYITKFHKEFQKLEGFNRDFFNVVLCEKSFESLKWGRGITVNSLVEFNEGFFNEVSKFKDICLLYQANKD